RITYATARSYCVERGRRNENKPRRNRAIPPTEAIVSLRSGAFEEAGRPLRRTRHRECRRRRDARARRDLDRAQGGRRLGGRPRRQSPAPPERRAPPRRLPVRGLRAPGRAARRERDARGRHQRLRERPPDVVDASVPARGDPRPARALVLRATLSEERLACRRNANPPWP